MDIKSVTKNGGTLIQDTNVQDLSADQWLTTPNKRSRLLRIAYEANTVGVTPSEHFLGLELNRDQMVCFDGDARLNGPADNPGASCMGCHASAGSRTRSHGSGRLLGRHLQPDGQLKPARLQPAAEARTTELPDEFFARLSVNRPAT